MHIRRGDFMGQCKSLPKTKTQEGDDCFPSLFAYEKHVEDTIEDLWLIHDIYVPNVIVMSGLFYSMLLFYLCTLCSFPPR